MQAMQDENDFLRDQLRRLSLELGRQHVPLSSVPEYTGVGQLPPWMASPEHVSPLMAAYDRRIGELEATCERLRTDNGRFQPEIQRLVAENERVRSEYKQSLLGFSGASTQYELGGNLGGFARRVTLEESQEFQQRLDLLMAENDVLTDQAREVGAEMQRLQREKTQHMQDASGLRRQLDDARADARDSSLRLDEVERERAMLDEQLGMAESELEQAQRVARDATESAQIARHERDGQAGSLVEHRRLVQELTMRAHADRDALSTELGRLRGTETISSKQLNELQAELDSAASREEVLTIELQAVRLEGRSLSQALREVEVHARELELREQAVGERFAEARASLDELQAERETIREAEAATRTQLVTADGRARELVAEETKRKEEAIDAVRRELNGTIEHLTAERRQLESACVELRHRLDRSRREKETDRRRDSIGGAALLGGGLLMTPGGVQPSGSVMMTPATLGIGGGGGFNTPRMFDDLMTRVLNSERERDETAAAARAEGAVARRKVDGLEQERAGLLSQLAEASRHQSRLQRELEDTRQARLLEASRAAELEAELGAARRDGDTVRRLAAADAIDTQRLHEEALAAVSRRLMSSKDMNAKTMGELEALLAAQEALTDKYRLEARRASERAAALVGEVRSENILVTARSAELSAQLGSLDARRAHAEQTERELGASTTRLQQQLSSAEARAADASSQVAGAIKEAASLRVDLTHAKEAIRASRKELAHATRPSSRSLGASASAAALDRYALSNFRNYPFLLTSPQFGP